MEPFLAEIRVVGFNFAPRGWALCDGRLLPVSQFSALFSLVGTMYGGDGITNFGLPDIQSQAVVSAGKGRGLSEYAQGEQGGVPAVTLDLNTMAAHTHPAQAAPDPADQTSPAPDRSLARSKPGNVYQSDTSTNIVKMSPQAINPWTGGGAPHNNMPPFQVLNYIIALVGIFPPRG